MAIASMPSDAWGRPYGHPDYGLSPSEAGAGSSPVPTPFDPFGPAGQPAGPNASGYAPGGGDDLGAAAQPGELPCCADPCVDPCTGMSPREADAYTAVLAELQTAEALLAVVLSELIDGTRTEIESLAALVHSLADEITGAVDITLSYDEDKLVKLVMSVVTATDRELNLATDWCLQVGIQVPYHPAEQMAMLHVDWIDMLIAAIPSLASVLGGSGGDGGDGGDGTSNGGNDGPTFPIGSGPLDPIDGSGTGGTGSGGTGGVVSPPLAPPPAPPSGGITLPPVVSGPTTTTTTTSGNTTTTTIYNNTTPTIPSPGSPPTLPPGVTINLTVPSAPVPPPPDITITLPPDDGAEPGVGAIAKNISDGIDWNKAVQAPVNPSDRAVNWNDPSACASAAKLSTAPGQNLAAAPLNQPGSMMGNYLRGKLQLKNWYPALLGPLGIPFELKQLADAWAQSESAQNLTLETMATTLAQESYVASIGANAVPNKSAAMFFGSKLAAARFLEGKTQFPLDYLMTSDRYLFQYANPQELPNQIRCDDAFLAGQITSELWECWTRANGNLPDPARRVMLGNQARPDVLDLITLWRRGHMREADLYARARERGVLDPNYVREWVATTTALPGQSDLVRFMVRDAADDQVAKEYGYDEGFAEKFTPQIQSWAKSLGLDETYFRYSWRSHWEIPSYTQLTEMYHRLRPDRAELREWDASKALLGEAPTVLALGPRPPVVDLDEVRQALQINDVAPRWVDAMVAIGYTPINRTDAIRAYQIGAFDEDRLADAFRDVGYSPADTATLVRYHAQDKARRRANVTGTWSPRKITSYYKKGYIGREKAAELLGPLTADAQEIKRTLDAADDEVAADTRAAAVRGVKRGVMSGEHSDADAIGLLGRFGVSPVVSERMVAAWVIDRDTRYKRISAAQAAKMLKDGLIGAEELRRRLRNLGYAIRDADLITAKALQVEGTADGLEPGELDGAITTAIRNRKEAERNSDGRLTARLKLLWGEFGRIAKELNKRREAEGKELIPSLPQLP